MAGDGHAVGLRLGDVVLYHYLDMFGLSCFETFDAPVRAASIRHLYPCFHPFLAFNHLISHHLITHSMSNSFLLGSSVGYDADEQKAAKDRSIQMSFDDAISPSMDDFEMAILRNEANICIQVQTGKTETSSETVTGDFAIVDYSPKALAVFGDTRPIKNRLTAIGGRFNARLTHEGVKTAGWVFSKTKEQELRNLLTIK